MSTTQTGVTAQDNVALDEDSAAEAFLSRWSEEDPEAVSETPEEESTETEDESAEEEVATEESEEDGDEAETDPEETSEESEDESTEEDSDEEAAEPAESKVLGDDKVVKVKVGDEELEVSVKDLKRLYGQEAAITKKNQALATERKSVEANGQKLAAQMQRVYDKVSARWEPYSKIDMLVASKQLDTEQFTALRAEAQSAYEDFQFITQEVDTFVKDATAQQQANLNTSAKEAIKVLKDAIPGWNQTVYNDVRKYAIDKGMPQETINNLVDPYAIEMIHKAMQFDKAKIVVTKKKVIQPKKVIKTTKVTTASDIKTDKNSKAYNKLRASGSVDDAADLFMARWAE